MECYVIVVVVIADVVAAAVMDRQFVRLHFLYKINEHCLFVHN